MGASSLLTIAIMAHLSPTALFMRSQSLNYHHIARPYSAAHGFTAGASARSRTTDHVPPSRRRRRRVRPAWNSVSLSQIEWPREHWRKAISGLSTAALNGDLLNGGGGAGASRMEHQAPGIASPSLPPEPLTHKQLPEESIYILDGTSMLFRGFYGRGANGYLAANGATEVGAVLAMGIELAQFIAEVKPRYIVVAFDVARETTFRRDIFPAYKAQRKTIPPDLVLQMPLGRALCEALGCRTFSAPGFEADDVMATLARWARSVGLSVVICSEDKDMCQLVGDRVHVMYPRRNGYAVLGAEEVRAKFGVMPASLPDLFGLAGDSSDNIPGVRGIGPKGGSRLLERFGNLESVFAGVESVGSSGIRGSKALQGLLSRPGVQEEAMLYREIATLHDEVPIDGVEDFRSCFFLYRGASPEAEGVMDALGFTAPLRMIQEAISPAVAGSRAAGQGVQPNAPALDISTVTMEEGK